MKDKSNSQSVIFNNEEYYKILKFDCSIVDLETINGGGYFTVLPVSTHSKVEVHKDETHTIFSITDDWGKANTMIIPNFMHEEIAIAVTASDKINKAYKA